MHIHPAFAALVTLTGLLPPLVAQVIGTENFSYPNGMIDGHSGGTGFNYNAFTATVTNTSSDWDGAATVNDNALVTDDNVAIREYNGDIEGEGTAANDAQDDHTRSGAVRGVGQVFYRFDINRSSTATWSGASSLAFDSERIFFGVPATGGGSDTIGIHDHGSGNITLGNTSITDGQTHSMVAVLDFENDLAGLFLDPTGGDYWNPADGTNNADVTQPFTQTDWSTSVRLGSGGQVTWGNLTVSLDASGVGLISSIADDDNDGLPGYWETANGLDDNDDGTVGETSPGAKDGPNGPLGDPDGDGLTNLQEFQLGTHPNNPDSDGDGFGDGVEIAAGTNPTNPASYPGADPQPGLIGVETFNYPDGPINNLRGGTHWDVDNSVDNDPFLGHTHTSAVWNAGGDPQVVNGVLVTNNTNARREYNGPALADETAGAIGEAAEHDQSVVYYRFEMTRRAGATWGGASSYDYSNEQYLFGVPNAINPVSGQREFSIHDLNANAHAFSGIQPVEGQTYLLVTKLDFTNNIAALYLDPDLTLPENDNSPVATYNHTSENWSTAVRFGSGGSGDVEWDNIRVASVWEALYDGLPEANDDQVTLRPGDKARIPVTANDTGSLNPYSVVIESPPSHGTVTPAGNGNVLYHHTGGTNAPDSFIYRVTNAGGDLSNTATVHINVTSDARFDTSFVNMPPAPPATTLSIVDALPGIPFDFPHGFCAVPGDPEKIFVTEGDGRVFIITGFSSAQAQKIEVLDITSQVEHDENELAMKGVAVHPQWDSNGYIYVTYNTTAGTARLSRFTTLSTAPYTASDELVLIDQANQGIYHNIGTCHFGAEGYLYVGFGDEGTQEDGYDNSQHIDKNIWSTVIRIDVDRRPENLIPNDHSGIPRVAPGDSGEAWFRIPADNPFVGATSFNGVSINPADVRTEMFIVGVRNPWQFSPEDLDGDGTVDELWVADVGRSDREEITDFIPGGNGGWAWREGSIAGARSGQTINGAAQSAATLTEPLWDYTRGGDAFQGSSITGGFIYRGTAMPQLTGKYIFCDFVSGNIWSLERTTPTPTIERLAGEPAIVGLMEGPDESILLLVRGNQGIGSIKRLTLGTTDSGFPPTLDDTNFFAEPDTLTPNPGGVAYEPNLRFWSDFAEKKRWFLLNNLEDKVGYHTEGPWDYPEGMIFVKHFDYPTQWETFTRAINGDLVTDRRPLPGSPRVRLETRFLVRNATGAYGVSYSWNNPSAPLNQAVLAENNGESFGVDITVNGTPETIPWTIPSRTACTICHTPEAGHALSFITRQLNRDGVIGDISGNFVQALDLAGYLTGFTDQPATLARHVRPDEETFSLGERVRAYLDVNCSYCHQSGGTGGGNWDGRSPLTLAQTGLVNGIPVDAPIQPGDLLVIPGDADHSILYNRTAGDNGYSRMPPLATDVIDLEGVELLADWINSEVSPYTTYESWRLARFGSVVTPEGAPDYDADGDGLTNKMEWLTHTDPQDSADRWQAAFRMEGENVFFEFFGLGDRRVRAFRSTDLSTWTPWQVPGNEGIPRNPGSLHTLEGTAGQGSEFFRLQIQPR